MAPQVTALPRPEIHLPTTEAWEVQSHSRDTPTVISPISASEPPKNCRIRGKLRAHGAVVERDADTKQAEVEVTKTSIADSVKAD